MAKNNKSISNSPAQEPKVVLSDTEKKQRKDSSKGKRTALSGKKYDDLKPAEKDRLIKAYLQSQGWLDETDTVV